MNLYDLMTFEELEEALREKLVRIQYHPTRELSILNYTEKAQFSKTWNNVTLNCRGLIIDTRTKNIVARPYPKFFNWGEQAEISLEEPVVVTDKLDGSLGIMYGGGALGPQIATRGSFTSDQAIYADAILQDKYPDFTPRAGWTLLFEIIYPSNRIVVDYKGLDDLVLLGAIDIQSGAIMGPEMVSDWPGPRTEVFPYKTFGEALSAPPRPGKEGLVVRSLMDDHMVKIKQDDYVQLHKIVTGLNERAVWERVKANPGDRDKILEGIPDELHNWVSVVATDLLDEMGGLVDQVIYAWQEIIGLEGVSPRDLPRAEFARRAKVFKPWVRTVLFSWLDDKHDRGHEFLWKQIKPASEKGPYSGSNPKVS